MAQVLGKGKARGRAQESGKDCRPSKVRNQGTLGTQCKQGTPGKLRKEGILGTRGKLGREGKEEQEFRRSLGESSR